MKLVAHVTSNLVCIKLDDTFARSSFTLPCLLLSPSLPLRLLVRVGCFKTGGAAADVATRVKKSAEFLPRSVCSVNVAQRGHSNEAGGLGDVHRL